MLLTTHLEVILAVALGSWMLVSKQKDEMLSESLERDQQGC